MTKDFALVWKRICDNQGNKFLTIRKESFEYKIEDECFIPLRPNKTPHNITKQHVLEAYKQWPVKGPVSFSDNIMAPSYLWGVFNDNRIISKEDK